MRPVVATRLTTHTQVLDDAVARLVAPEPEELAEALMALIESPEERKRIGEAGRAYVNAEFSEARFRARLESFYGQLAGAV